MSVSNHKPNMRPTLFDGWGSIAQAVRRVDEDNLGTSAMTLLRRLYPLCRSITGDGVRETLAILGEIVNLRIQEVPTGYQALDWTVPKEWNIRDAYVRNEQGERVIDFNRSNLHVLNYSIPVFASMTLEELLPHLYTLPDQPDAIPYRTSYYEENWGFCLAQLELDALAEGIYDVRIESSLEDGHLTFADVVLPGSSEQELFFSTYTCHPSLANHELSGPVVLALVCLLLSQCEHRYTYRFLFAPETIGSLVYLSQNGSYLKDHMQAGYVVASVGAPGPFTYKRSRRGGTPADRVAEHCLQHSSSGTSVKIRDFDPLGSDERQYCSPGFNLPVGVLSHLMYDTYPEYHTSLDNLEFVSSEIMVESLRMCMRMVQVHELNQTYMNLSPYGEPQLGKRGMYPSVSGTASGSYAAGSEAAVRKLYLLAYSDGSNDLIDIANRMGRPVWEFAQDIEDLANVGLLGLAK